MIEPEKVKNEIKEKKIKKELEKKIKSENI